MWGVFFNNYRITKKPMTEYEAILAKSEWERCLSNLVIRQIENKPDLVMVVAVAKKSKKQRKNRIIRPVEVGG